jgi:hypothetical protein
MPSRISPHEEVAVAANLLMDFLQRNTGSTADWPIRIMVDNTRDQQRLSDLLNNLKKKLELLPQTP